MQILELLFLINGLKKCKWTSLWTSLCTWYVIFALFTHFFYISKTDKILPFLSQFSRKFLQHFWGNRFTCMFRVEGYSNKLNVHLYSNDLKELEEVLLFLVPFRSLVFDTFWCHVFDLDNISTYFLSIFFNWVVGECLCKRFICLIHVRKIYWLCSTSDLRSYCINHQEFVYVNFFYYRCKSWTKFDFSKRDCTESWSWIPESTRLWIWWPNTQFE